MKKQKERDSTMNNTQLGLLCWLLELLLEYAPLDIYKKALAEAKALLLKK